MQDGDWGMNFACFDGYFDTKDTCTDSSRIGLNPFDPSNNRTSSGDDDLVGQSEDLENGNKQINPAAIPYKKRDVSDAVVISTSVVGGVLGLFLLVISIITCIVCVRRSKRRAAAQGDDFSQTPAEGVFKQEDTTQADDLDYGMALHDHEVPAEREGVAVSL